MPEPPTLKTSVSRAEHGENQFRGYAVGRELAGRVSHWFAVALAVGHRGLDDVGVGLFDDIAVCTLSADPHIWPLKVTRLATCYGALVPGLAAGMLSTSGGIIGWGTYEPAARMLVRLAEADDIRPALDAERRDTRHLPGFGVAFRDEDERAVMLKRCVRRRNMDRGRYWQTMLRADEYLRSLRAPVNIGGATTAILLDLGFTPEQMQPIILSMLVPNYLANAVEGAAQAPAILRQLPAHTIEDRTPPPRKSPRARGEDR